MHTASLQAVTVDMLRAELTTAELGSIPRTVTIQGGAEASVDGWLAEKLMQACDRVVAAINSCRENEAIATGLSKVPQGCVRTALVLARHAVISSVPAMAETLEGSSRAAEYQTATRELSELASCQLRPEYTLVEGEALNGASGGITLLGRPADNFVW